jgi:hypothetical protein
MKLFFKSILYFILGLPAVPKPFTKKMKLGASYSVFDGEELLEFSIKQIRPYVDYITVVWQDISWRGNPAKIDLHSFLLNLQKQGLVDKLIYFKPNLKLQPSRNEINKRNIGLQDAKKNNCTHFMTMDCDEFYVPEEFKTAKELIAKNGITHSFVYMVDYAGVNVRFKNYNTGMFCPFIYKIGFFAKFKNKYNGFFNCIPCVVDSTRKIPIKKTSSISIVPNLTLHHFPLVRKSVEGYFKKLDNSSINTSSANIDPFKAKFNKEFFDMVAQIEETKISNDPNLIYVKNMFDIRL